MTGLGGPSAPAYLALSAVGELRISSRLGMGKLHKIMGDVQHNKLERMKQGRTYPGDESAQKHGLVHELQIGSFGLHRQ